MPEKLLPPGVSIVTAADVLLMKVKVETYTTREEAQGIIDANKPFWQGELRPTGEVFEIWKPLAKMSTSQLPLAKRGDLIRLLLKFADGTEFVTGVIVSKAAGLIRCKVYSRPEKTRSHGVNYGDELVVHESQIITHESATEKMGKEIEPFLTGTIPDAEPVNAKDAEIRAVTQKLPPLAPESNREYWTRNGTVVKVWTFKSYGTTQCARCGRQLLGSNIQNEACPQAPGQLHSWQNAQHAVWIGGSSDGAAIEWNQDGSHAGGIRDLDIVKDPKNNEVVA